MNSVNFIKSFNAVHQYKLTKSVNHGLTTYRNLRKLRNRSVSDVEYFKLHQKLMNHILPGSSSVAVEQKHDQGVVENKDSSKDTSKVAAKKSKMGLLDVRKIITPTNQFELLADRVTPLHKLPYKDQLQQKYWKNLNIMRKFGVKLKDIGTKVALGTDTLPCVLDPIIPSPVTEYYRNKDEFSIRTGVDDDPKTVGFYLNSPADEDGTICVGPDELSIIKGSHKMFALLFQNYIRYSLLPACHNFDTGGYWRNLVVRSNKQGEIMGLVIMHPQDLTQEQLAEEKQKLKDQFINSPRLGLKLTSFYFQACPNTRCTHAEAPFELLFGEPYIFEQMNELKYRISPESFFQTNTLAAEKLYKVILNACKPTKSVTVLDICCGIGPVSFTFAPHVKNCIGMDQSKEAIRDAKANAKINDITNVKFYAGDCESVLQNVLNKNYSEELIAVINPARGSIAKNVFRILRGCKCLKKIVYVCCKPEAAIDYYVELCRPAAPAMKLGSPFYPMRAVPIDLFPQTEHCELIVLFQRL